MESRWPRRVVILAALAGAGVLARWTVLRPDPVAVTVFRVARGRVEESVTNSKAGTIRSRRRAALSPEIGGRVAELPVRKGDRVKAGQVLLRLASEDLEAEVRREERSLEAARAAEREAGQRAEGAERELARMKRLAAGQLVSLDLQEKTQTERDMASASCEAARARVEQAQALLDLARVNLRKTELRAPFGGVVAELRSEVGEWITPSPPGVPIPAVLELIDTDRIYLSAPLDEVDAGKVKVGQEARVTMDAYPGRSFPGRVGRVAPYVADLQQQSRTFETEVELDDAAFARTLLPGSSADVEAILDRRDGALRIPSYALIEGAKVLVLRDGKLVSVPVRVGLKNWEFAEVREGLKEGEAVVVSLDRPEVKEGARARVAGETTK